jgi:hypothetical protein
VVREPEYAGPNRRLRTVAEILGCRTGHNFGLGHFLTGGPYSKPKEEGLGVGCFVFGRVR